MIPKICFIISTYNEDITNEIFNSAKKELDRSGIKKADVAKDSIYSLKHEIQETMNVKKEK